MDDPSLRIDCHLVIVTIQISKWGKQQRAELSYPPHEQEELDWHNNSKSIVVAHLCFGNQKSL